MRGSIAVQCCGGKDETNDLNNDDDSRTNHDDPEALKRRCLPGANTESLMGEGLLHSEEDVDEAQFFTEVVL